MSASLYLSHVMHQRLRPRPHRLAYSLFSLFIDIDRLEEASAGLRWFSINRFNLFSFFEKDRGDGRPRGLRAYVQALLAKAGLDEPGLRVQLLTMPRVLGFSFNPLSVYYIARPDGTLKAMLWEVDNTFGERHSYLIPVAEPGAGDHLIEQSAVDHLIEQSADKAFYVSPFMPMKLAYRFRFRPPGERLTLHITVSDAQGPLLIAAQSGARQPLTDASLMKLFWRLPVQPVLVLGGIHWEALKIWRKGIALVKKPPGHTGETTIAKR